MYDQAAYLDPENRTAHHGRAVALTGLKRYSEALEAFEQTLQLNAQDESIYLDKGRLLLKLKRRQEATVTLEHALALVEAAIAIDSANAAKYTSKAYILFYLRRYQEALAACERALELNPKSENTHRLRVRTLFNLRRFKESFAAARQAASALHEMFF